MKFNVGDRVQQIGGKGDPYESPVGLVGEVVGYDEMMVDVVFPDIDEVPWPFFENELDFYVEEPTA